MKLCGKKARNSRNRISQAFAGNERVTGDVEELHGLGRENGSRFKQKTIKQGKFIRMLSLHLKQNTLQNNLIICKQQKQIFKSTYNKQKLTINR